MKYHHFSIEEREIIQKGLWERKSIRTIASCLKRSPSSVAREVRRNLSAHHHRYTPRLAHARAVEYRAHRGRGERLKNAAVRRYVTARLKAKWSPEQIAGKIFNDIHLRLCLRRRRKCRVPKGARRGKRMKPQGVSIEARPLVVQRKMRYGDWEGDTVESCHHLPGVNTLLERKSGMVFVTKLAGKDAASTTAAVRVRLARLPDHMRRTLTLDNGPENNGWRDIESTTGVRCFFAHPYSSHERGANENVNGLFREYFPKGTDFRMIPVSQLRRVERSLNTRPRKRLGWKTPEEVFRVALQG